MIKEIEKNTLRGRRLDLEQICLLCAVVFFSVGFGFLILLAIPQTYFLLHLGFWHFIVSLTLLSASVVLVLIRQFYWYSGDSPEKSYYPYITFNRNNPTLPENGKKSERLEAVEPPGRERLQALKEVLGLKEGSLQYKKRGQGIYHVVYSEGKHQWIHIGSWVQLREKLDLESAVE